MFQVWALRQREIWFLVSLRQMSHARNAIRLRFPFNGSLYFDFYLYTAYAADTAFISQHGYLFCFWASFCVFRFCHSAQSSLVKVNALMLRSIRESKGTGKEGDGGRLGSRVSLLFDTNLSNKSLIEWVLERTLPLQMRWIGIHDVYCGIINGRVFL